MDLKATINIGDLKATIKEALKECEAEKKKEEEFMRVPECAVYLKVSTATVFRRIKDGKVKSKNLGKTILIPKSQFNN